MQQDKTKPKYVSSSRARSTGRSAFSGQNFFAQATNNASAAAANSETQKRSRILKIIGISAISILVILAIIVMTMRRFVAVGAGDLSIETFNSRIEYHDAMKCTLSESGKTSDSDFMLLANDGWSEVYLRNIWLADNVTDVFYVNERIYTVVYDGAKKDRNIIKEKSFIESKKQFKERTGLDFPEGLKLANDDVRKIHCEAQGNDIEYRRPNVSYFTNLYSEGVE